MYAGAAPVLSGATSIPNFVASTIAVTSPLQDPAEERLGQGAAVDVGRVEQGDAGVDRGVHHAFCASFVDAPAEVVASESEDADLERADLPGLHRPDANRERVQAWSWIVFWQAVAPPPSTASSHPCR